MKRYNDIKSLEAAILSKFEGVRICDVHRSKFGIRVLGLVPARGEYDSDHIVEWTEEGMASECMVDDRDYREIGWSAEEQRPVYIDAKLLLHNERFDLGV